MRRLAHAPCSLVVAMIAACGAPAVTPAAQWPTMTLAATSGETAVYPRDLASSRFTVFVFFAKDCPCFGAHEARLRALVDKYGARGVRFVIVDPEVGHTVEDDARAVSSRHLPGPVFLDSGARLASMVGAVYATYSVVVDASGQIRYRGGIDSDKSHLQADTTPYLADALDDLTAGRAPRRAEGKTLGCALQMW
ncbi:MAG TPA: redoxin family protein [Kofleriaceae bacterium]|nr:redoxin family protein [Kofleriaceae bacterium]